MVFAYCIMFFENMHLCADPECDGTLIKIKMASTIKFSADDSINHKGTVDKIASNAKSLHKKLIKDPEHNCKEETIAKSVQYITELAKHLSEEDDGSNTTRTRSATYNKYILDKLSN